MPDHGRPWRREMRGPIEARGKWGGEMAKTVLIVEGQRAEHEALPRSLESARYQTIVPAMGSRRWIWRAGTGPISF